MKKSFLAALAAVVALGLNSCSSNDEPDWGPTVEPEDVEGLFVACGAYGYQNASVSFYNPATGKVANEVFYNANNMKLGDVAQSVAIESDDAAWVIVNNSNVMFRMSLKGENRYRETGRVTGLVSPRYAAFVNDNKMYVSQMYSDKIAIVDPKKYEITGYVTVPGMSNVGGTDGDTEEFVRIDSYYYVNCWSYQSNIARIDPATDKVEVLNVGIQPCSMAYDGNGTLWVLCDGGSWEQNPAGYEAPSLVAVDTKTFKVTKTVELTKGSYVSSLCYYAGNIYWLDGGVKRMCVSGCDDEIETIIPSESWGLSALTVNPSNGDIYVADALDYTQSAVVSCYTNSGKLLSKFNVGVSPNSFTWLLDD